MRALIRSLWAEFQKTKRLPIRIIHLVIPICVAAAFSVYYLYSSWNASVKLTAYFQILGIGFPFLIGLFCAMTAEQEQSAGNFQEILAVPERKKSFWGKLLLLMLFGLFSVCLASFLFWAGCPKKVQIGVFADYRQAFQFYVKAALLLWGSSLFLYMLHLFLALHVNGSVSMVLGIGESLVAALFLTGLGDGIWMYVPASWASRMVTELLFVAGGQYFPLEEFKMAVGACVLLTTVGAVCFSIWCCHWEGKSSSD